MKKNVILSTICILLLTFIGSAVLSDNTYIDSHGTPIHFIDGCFFNGKEWGLYTEDGIWINTEHKFELPSEKRFYCNNDGKYQDQPCTK